MTKPMPARLYLYLYLLFMAALSGAAAEPAFAPRERNLMPSDSPKIAQTGRSEPLPLPRDPNLAVREEFDMARTQNTVEAWELFIARHGEHRLAAEARKELGKLKPDRAAPPPAR